MHIKSTYAPQNGRKRSRKIILEESLRQMLARIPVDEISWPGGDLNEHIGKAKG